VHLVWPEVEGRLAALGLTPRLPLVRERHRWSDRWRDLCVSLFPSYLLAEADGDGWRSVLRTPRVLTQLKEAGKPKRLSDESVQGLRAAIAAECAARRAVFEVLLRFTPVAAAQIPFVMPAAVGPHSCLALGVSNLAPVSSLPGSSASLTSYLSSLLQRSATSLRRWTARGA
jgi:hypothetical protein